LNVFKPLRLTYGCVKGKGPEARDQRSGSRGQISGVSGRRSPVKFAPVKRIRAGFTPMEYKIQMHSIGHAG